MDIESVVLVISVILLFVIGYVAVGVLIPRIRGRSESAETDAESKKHTARKMNRAVFAY